MEVDDKEAAEDETEAEDAANEVTEEEDQVKLKHEQEQLISYCLALEENERLREQQSHLPGILDLVVEPNTVDMGMLMIEDIKLDHQFAEIAMNDNDENLLAGIDFNDLYWYHTRQPLRRQHTDRQSAEKSTTCADISVQAKVHMMPQRKSSSL